MPDAISYPASRNKLFEKAYRHEISDEFYKSASVLDPVLDRTRTVFQAYNLPFNENA
jgi:hypothetical protein